MRLAILAIMLAGCAATPAPKTQPIRQVMPDGNLIDTDGCILDQNGDRVAGENIGCKQYGQ